MSEGPLHPSQSVLDDAIEDTIDRVVGEWNLSSFEVIGVLHMIAARIAHRSMEHDED